MTVTPSTHPLYWKRLSAPPKAERPARIGRNPATGEEIEIAATKTVKFKAGSALKDAVKGA